MDAAISNLLFNSLLKGPELCPCSAVELPAPFLVFCFFHNAPSNKTQGSFLHKMEGAGGCCRCSKQLFQGEPSCLGYQSSNQGGLCSLVKIRIPFVLFSTVKKERLLCQTESGVKKWSAFQIWPFRKPEHNL